MDMNFKWTTRGLLEGDLVLHRHKEVGEIVMGRVVGFGPDRRWVRVRTTDGRVRTWLDSHLLNVTKLGFTVEGV